MKAHFEMIHVQPMNWLWARFSYLFGVAHAGHSLGGGLARIRPLGHALGRRVLQMRFQLAFDAPAVGREAHLAYYPGNKLVPLRQTHARHPL